VTCMKEFIESFSNEGSIEEGAFDRACSSHGVVAAVDSALHRPLAMCADRLSMTVTECFSNRGGVLIGR
jgi:hypothetical protein